MCVNSTYLFSPGLSSPFTVAVFSSELLSVTTTLLTVWFPLFVTVTLYVIVSPNAYFPFSFLAVLVTVLTKSYFVIGSSVSVVTSFEGSSPIVATFTTFLAVISFSVTMCVNSTSLLSPGLSSPFTVAVFSSELLSVTTTSFTVWFPLFVTVTLYVIVSPNAYFPSLSLSVPVTVLTKSYFVNGSSVSTVTFSVSFPSDVATFTTSPSLMSASVTICVNVNSALPFTAMFVAVLTFSSELLSFTVTVFNTVLPVFVTVTLYVTTSPKAYFPFSFLAVLVTSFLIV